MLSGVEQEKTPLTKQLDQLTVLITLMAAAALGLIVIMGLVRGDDFDEIFTIGITLAIAAIPTGLPAVVTMLLSVGTQQMAAQGGDHQAPQVGRDAGVDVCDLLGQDRHADPQPDDRPRARRRRAAVQHRRRGLLVGGQDPARVRHERCVARAVHDADGAGERRRHPRRRVHRRPHRGGARRARRQGRARRRTRRGARTRASARCRSTPSTS